MIKLTEAQSARIRRKIDRASSCGCQRWLGAVDHKGFGLVRINGKSYKAHRVVYEMFHSHPPKGSQILHTCHNPACCEITHLFAAPVAGNFSERARAWEMNRVRELYGLWARGLLGRPDVPANTPDRAAVAVAAVSGLPLATVRGLVEFVKVFRDKQGAAHTDSRAWSQWRRNDPDGKCLHPEQSLCDDPCHPCGTK